MPFSSLRLVLMAALACVGCSSDAPEASHPTAAGTSAAPAEIRPIPWEKLAELLPEKIGDWKRDPPQGQLIDTPSGHFSHVQAFYRNPARTPALLQVQISDGTRATGFYQAFEVKRATRIDTPVSRYANFEIAGQPAVEIACVRPLSTAISVLVAARFLVDVECETVDAQELRAFVGALDLAKLARME